MKLISSNQYFRIPVTEINQRRFIFYLFVDINKKHIKNASFIWILLSIAISCYHNILEDLQLDLTKDFFSLCNSIADFYMLKNCTISQWNKVLISMIYLAILYYTWNKYTNFIKNHMTILHLCTLYLNGLLKFSIK